MTNQVTSIEQSKRLLELGVPAEKASMVWDTITPASRPILRVAFDADVDTRRWKVDNINSIPAFTVADLIAILPTTCGGFQIGLDRVRNDSTHIFYEDSADSSNIIFFMENSLVESCVKAIEWVVSNNYKLNI